MKNQLLKINNPSRTVIFAVLLTLLLPFSVFAQDYWESTGALSGTDNTFRIITDSEDRIFAGVWGTGIFLSLNHGVSWTLKGLTGVYIRDIAVNSDDHIFAVGNNRVFRTTNNGNTWQNISIGLPDVSIKTVAIDSDGRIFVGLNGNLIYRSIDNGNTWVRLENGLSSNTAYVSMAINSLGHIFAGTNGAHIYRSTDHGNNWQRLTSGLAEAQIWALVIDSEDRIYAGSGNGIYVSTNNGATWTATTATSGTFDINDMTVNSEDHVFATNYHGGVWRSNDHGSSWDNVDDPVVGVVSWGIGMTSDDYLFCGNANAQVYKSTNPTTATHTSFVPIAANLQAMSSSSVEWGDFDNDGDLDILAVGMDDNSNYAKIYRNDGADTFVDLPTANLQAVINGPVTWGDYDNDGDLDLLLTGWDGGSSNFSILYENDGAGGFTDQTQDLTPMGSGSVAWVDYDNDGDLDIFMSGWNGSESFALIYQNNHGIFSDINAGLPGLRFSDSPWGDYDNDGDLDLLLTGWNDTDRFTQIFRNDDGIFTDIEAGLTLIVGAAAWGDYDSDGDLDILLAGYSIGSTYETVFYENDSGLFTETGLGLPKLNRGTVDWGDYDSDGDLDILLTGNHEGILMADIYQNDAGVFTALHAGLQAVKNSAVAWGDYDRDGDLDILLTGHDGTNHHTIIYRNDMDANNTIPSAPGNLNSAASGSDVTLSWSGATDIETPNIALSYNIRIGTTPGGEDIKTAHADLSTGLRRLVSLGNVQQNNSWTIRNLENGIYYWSVQSLDNSYAGSQFSVEHSFALGDAPIATTNEATNLATTAATLNATINPNGLETTVVFEYGLSDNYGSQVPAIQSPLSGTANVAVHADLTGLVEDQKYNFRVVATSLIGTSYGEDQFFMTVSGGNLPTATSTAATDITLSSATLNGMVNSSDLSTSVLFEYGLTTAYGLEISASPSPLTGTDDVEVSAELSSLLENTAYHYRVVAENTVGVNLGDDLVFTTLMNYPTTFNLNITGASFPSFDDAGDYSATDYRLVGLPGSSDLMVNTLLNGSHGDDWQLYWDNGNSEDYLVEYDGSSVFNFSVGRAFWLINKGSFDINTSVNSASLNSDDQIEIPLHSGWNLITNPIMSSFSWSSIQDLNGISDPIWTYDGSFNQTNDFASYLGYYYFNTDDLANLKVPYQANAIGKLSSEIDQGDQWQIEISLRSGEFEAGSIQLGVSSDAEAGIDRLDFRKPHGIGQLPSVIFNRTDWGTDHSVFASDIRPPATGSEAWDFNVTNLTSDPVCLTFEGAEQIPLDQAVFLVNQETGRSIDLRMNDHYEFIPNSVQMTLTIVVGPRDQVQDYMSTLVPQTLILANNYPNPFNPLTTIRYAVPIQAEVTLSIFDISGRCVKTLVQDSQSAGWYTIQWAGTNGNGLAVEAGVYFAQIQVRNLSRVIRMVYLP